ncbi:MAG TPA: 7-cyano-7-deazaguanine synthase [Candidatus Binataceae bacterium]|nr:7-cyano-7-deazaguanine synthase [Candidatus Binataceae bacterium]
MTAKAGATPAFDYRIEALPERVAILASGGLDSSVLLGVLARRRREVYPVYVRTGLVWESAEVMTLRRFIRALRLNNVRPVTILRLPMNDLAGDHWSMTGRNVPGYDAAVTSNYILGRNLTLLSKAAIFCARMQIGEIAMAPLESNPFPDARPEFFRAVGRAVELGVGIKLKVTTPFAGLSKAEVIRRGSGMPLVLTLSCARPQRGIHCGGCTKCAERIEGFREAGIADPTVYASAGRRKPAQR